LNDERLPWFGYRITDESGGELSETGVDDRRVARCASLCASGGVRQPEEIVFEMGCASPEHDVVRDFRHLLL
jgi:hypothetical protein